MFNAGIAFKIRFFILEPVLDLISRINDREIHIVCYRIRDILAFGAAHNFQPIQFVIQKRHNDRVAGGIVFALVDRILKNMVQCFCHTFDPE